MKICSRAGKIRIFIKNNQKIRRRLEKCHE
jgi:hypothetical protein